MMKRISSVFYLAVNVEYGMVLVLDLHDDDNDVRRIGSTNAELVL